MRLRDEIELDPQNTEGTVIYLSNRYKELAPSTAGHGHSIEVGGAHNMFDELAACFAAQGIKVTSDADATFAQDQRSLMLLVLCPGFFRNSALVEESSVALKNIHRLRFLNPNSLDAQRGSGRCIASRKISRDRSHSSNCDRSEGIGAEESQSSSSRLEPPSRLRAGFRRAGFGLNLVALQERSQADVEPGVHRGGTSTGAPAGAPGAAPPVPMLRQKSSSSSLHNRSLSRMSSGLGGRMFGRKPKVMVPLFSTSGTYEDYMRTCPPDLKDLGIFDLNFDKWPESSMLQEVAVKVAISKLPGQKHATRYERAQAVFTGRGGRPNAAVRPLPATTSKPNYRPRAPSIPAVPVQSPPRTSSTAEESAGQTVSASASTAEAPPPTDEPHTLTLKSQCSAPRGLAAREGPPRKKSNNQEIRKSAQAVAKLAEMEAASSSSCSSGCIASPAASSSQGATSPGRGVSEEVSFSEIQSSTNV